MDLIRGLLLKLEAYPAEVGSVYMIDPSDPDIAIEGFSADEIAYHLDLLLEAGYIEAPGSQTMNGIIFSRLSWAGHNFIDSVRDPKIWTETKEGAQKVGAFSVDLLSALAKGLIKRKIEEYTGVQLSL